MSYTNVPQLTPSRSSQSQGLSSVLVLGSILWGVFITCLAIAAFIFAVQNISPIRGPEGPSGHDGVCTGNCLNGTAGLPGTNGTNGTNGINCSCNATSYAQFQAQQPFDNPNPLVPGAAVNLTLNGPSRGTGILRVNGNTFLIVVAGTYRFTFTASVNEAAQMALFVVGVGLTPCLAGRTNTFTQLIFDCYYAVLLPSTQIQVVNPAGEVGPITMTPNAGGAYATPTVLIIEQK